LDLTAVYLLNGKQEKIHFESGEGKEKRNQKYAKYAEVAVLEKSL